jgi:hypothetical protein
MNQPHIIEAELIGIILHNIRNRPRSKQQLMGPSEIGHPCARKLIHKLAGHREPRGFIDPWFAEMGTFAHAGLETGFRTWQDAQGFSDPRYLLEHEVTVGQVGGIDITGKADLFDTGSGCLVDWKAVGPDPLKRYKVNGPGIQYRRQAALYGRGFALQGYKVNTVMIAFLPRNGAIGTAEFTRTSTGMLTDEWANRGNRYFWSEPYDENVALEALSRVNGLAELLKVMPVDDLLEMYPECRTSFCPWCK